MAVTTPQLPSHRRREEEQQWREEGKFLVTFFGLLDLKIVALRARVVTLPKGSTLRRECEWRL